MPAGAVGLVAIAAVCHASWNLITKRTGGGITFLWLFGVAATILILPVAWLEVGRMDRALERRDLIAVLGSGFDSHLLLLVAPERLPDWRSLRRLPGRTRMRTAAGCHRQHRRARRSTRSARDCRWNRPAGRRRRHVRIEPRPGQNRLVRDTRAANRNIYRLLHPVGLGGPSPHSTCRRSSITGQARRHTPCSSRRPCCARTVRC